MCGRYAYFMEKELDDLYSILRDIESQIRIGEIAPSNVAPVLVPAQKNSSDKLFLTAVAMSWGWPRKTKGLHINARAESLDTQALYKKAMQFGRCVAPASGFFEWQQVGKNKLRYFCTLAEQETMFLAGLHQKVVSTKGILQDAFVVITRQSSNDFEWLHPRMPLLIKKTDLHKWFAGEDLSFFTQSNLDRLQIAKGHSSNEQLELF